MHKVNRLVREASELVNRADDIVLSIQETERQLIVFRTELVKVQQQAKDKLIEAESIKTSPVSYTPKLPV